MFNSQGYGMRTTVDTKISSIRPSVRVATPLIYCDLTAYKATWDRQLGVATWGRATLTS